MSENNRSRVDRREFLQAGAAVTAASALTLGTGVVSAQDKDQAKPKVILPTRKLGAKTGDEVTILTVGTGAWKSLGSASDRLLRLAYAKGIRYLDTAKAYGTEPAISRFFKAVPEAKKDTFVVTKDTPRSPKQLIEQLDQRLASLELDSVDAFFFHGLGDHHTADECIEFLKGQEFRETADAIRKSGKAKYIGFSVHHPRLAEMITTAARANVVDMIMMKYNAFAAKDHPFNKALDACPRQGHRPDLDEATRRLRDDAEGHVHQGPRPQGQGARPLPDAPARDLDRRADLLVLRVDEDHRPDERERPRRPHLSAAQGGRAARDSRVLPRLQARPCAPSATAGAPKPPAPVPRWAN